MSNLTSHTPFTVRLATSTDSRQLARLAALDSSPVPTGELVIAELDGRITAAMPLAGGVAIADPFTRTKAIVDLLALRAEQLRAAGAERPQGFLSRVAGLFERPALRVN